jgi:hypothetical protein
VHAETYRGEFTAGTYGRSVCFASTSPGEVFVGEHKLVGISQRRGRDGARLQCVLYRSWSPEAWVSSLTATDIREQIASLSVATISAEAEIFKRNTQWRSHALWRARGEQWGDWWRKVGQGG